MLLRRLYSGALALAFLPAATAFSAGPPVSGRPPASASAEGDAPTSVLDDFAVTRWRTAEGLPEDAVSDLILTEDGYLWCLAARSLARFDGTTFESVDLPAPVRAPSWHGLSESPSGTLWIFGDSGACRYAHRPGGPPPWAGSPLPPMTPILAVLQQTDARFWAVSTNGVYQVDHGTARFFALPKRPGLGKGGIEAVAVDRFGWIWIAVGAMILRFDRDHYEVDRRLDGPVRQLSVNHYGRLWAATDTALYDRRKAGPLHVPTKEGTWTTIPLPPHRGHPRWHITTLKALSAGELWVGTTSGLYRWRRERWSELTPRDGFYPLEIRCIERDTDHNMWVGTSGGLLRLRPRLVQVYDSGLGLLKHSFTAVLPDPDVGLLIGVAGGGLLEGKPGAFHAVGRVPVSRTAVVSALLRSRDGALWIGTQGDYLWRCLGGKARCITEPSGVDRTAVNVNALLQDRQGRIWAGTGNGVMTYNPGRGQLEPPGSDRLAGAVHALLEDRDGAVWAGLQGEGLARIAPDGSVAVFRREQGLPDNTVLALSQDADGILWAGTAGGLARWDGRRWASVTVAEGLPEGPVSQLLAEGDDLWLGTRYGIALLSRTNLAEVASGERASVAPRMFGRTEGMRDEQCSSGFGNLAARDAAGRLWFSTLDGLVMIDPQRVDRTGAGGCRAYLDAVRAGRTRLWSWRDDLSHAPFRVTVPAGAGPLTVRLSAPAFSAPEQVQFKVLLAGFDPSWSAPTFQRTVAYPRLPPGVYRFRLMAGRGNSWMESLQTVAVEIKPLLWQRRGFWGGTVILAMALVAFWVRALDRRQSRRQFLKLEQAQSLERERSRIARDLHDDLGASLTEIGLLSAVARRPSVSAERARDYLEDINSKARGLVETLDEIVWAINPRNDTVTSLADYFCEYARRMLHLSAIRCRLDLAPDLPPRPLDPDRRHNLFLAFHEALNNVIRHSGATEAVIRLRLEAGRLLVAISDDGRGFEPDSADPKHGNGLRSMRHRLEQVGGVFNVTSRPGNGTTVTFTVPLT